jgi:hypothetical protein
LHGWFFLHEIICLADIFQIQQRIMLPPHRFSCWRTPADGLPMPPGWCG